MAGPTNELRKANEDCEFLTRAFLRLDEQSFLSFTRFSDPRRTKWIDVIDRVISSSREKFEIPFRSIDKHIETKLENGLKLKDFETISNQLFKGEINWGRIAMMFAMLKLVTDGKEKEVEYKRFVSNKLSLWVASNGGWDEILRFETRTFTDLLFSAASALAASLVAAATGLAIGRVVAHFVWKHFV